MSYKSDLKCMAEFMRQSRDSGGYIWFTLPGDFPLKCHDCDRRVVCRKTLSEYAKVINEYEKIRESKGEDTIISTSTETIGNVLISTARSIGH